jgi:hypothetical protein
MATTRRAADRLARRFVFELPILAALAANHYWHNATFDSSVDKLVKGGLNPFRVPARKAL